MNKPWGMRGKEELQMTPGCVIFKISRIEESPLLMGEDVDEWVGKVS